MPELEDQEVEPSPPEPAEVLGLAERILVAPLLPFLLVWDMAKALVTRTIPAAWRKLRAWLCALAARFFKPLRRLAALFQRVARQALSALRAVWTRLTGMVAILLTRPLKALWHRTRVFLATVARAVSRLARTLGSGLAVVARRVLVLARSMARALAAPIRTMGSFLVRAVRAAARVARRLLTPVLGGLHRLGSLARILVVTVGHAASAVVASAAASVARAASFMARALAAPIRALGTFVARSLRAAARRALRVLTPVLTTLRRVTNLGRSVLARAGATFGRRVSLFGAKSAARGRQVARSASLLLSERRARIRALLGRARAITRRR